MTAAGMVLSQPTSAQTASNMCPITASSIESAMTSRETSEARIPSVPIATPSDTEIVLNSIGVPPASRTPSLTAWASWRRCRLHGITSVQVLTTATSGRSRSASVRPVALSMARAGARDSPLTRASLRRGRAGGLEGSGMGSGLSVSLMSGLVVRAGVQVQKRKKPPRRFRCGGCSRGGLLRAAARTGR